MASSPSRHHRLFTLLTLPVMGVLFAVGFIGIFTVKTLLYPLPRTDLRMEGPWLLVPDPVLGYAAAPEVSTTFRHLDSGLRYTVHTDALGARVAHAGQQAPDRAPIVAIGGSFTWGHGVAYQETWAYRLQSQRQTHVVNLGLAGYGTVQSLLSLGRVSSLKPKLVLYGFIQDHLRRNLSPCAPHASPLCLPSPYVHFRDDGRPELRRPPLGANHFQQDRALFQQVLSQPGFQWPEILWRMRLDLGFLERSADQPYAFDAAARQTSVALLLKNLTHICDGLGARAVFLYIPYLSEPPQPMPVWIRETVEEAGLGLVDLTPAFAEVLEDNSGVALVLADGFHPSAEAHRVIAEAVARWVDAAGLDLSSAATNPTVSEN